MWSHLKNSKQILRQGFTLVELLIVISIISVLVTILSGGFRNSQTRGRDVQRKSDLKEIANSLELFYSDYNKYPDSSAGSLQACPFSLVSGGSNCTWGSSQFTDGKTAYFKVVPKDPTNTLSYYYRIVDPPTNQKYQIFAHLENSEDKDCLDGDCAAPPVAFSCGSKTCNFAVTSSNATPTE